MKTFKSSDLAHKRAEVLKEAKANGVIIQQPEANGVDRQEFILIPVDSLSRVIVDDELILSEGDL